MTNDIALLETIGTSIPSTADSLSDILTTTGYNWNVEQRDIYQNRNGVTTVIPQLVGNFKQNTDTLFGIVSRNDYKVVQNSEAFDFIDELDGFTFSKIGGTASGSKVFIVGKTEDKIYVDGNTDPIDMYVTFIHGHDGKSGIKIIVTPIRVFCLNQMNLLLENNYNKFSVTHTGNIETKLKHVHNALENSSKYMTALEKEITTLKDISLDKNQVTNIVTKLFPIDEDSPSKRSITVSENQIEVVLHLYNNKDDLSNYRGTAFGVISAVSDYVSHRKPIRNTNHYYDNEFLRNIENLKLVEKTRELIAA